MMDTAATTPEAPASPPPALHECVSVITTFDASSASTARKKGELSLSLLGFCYHLASDNAKVSKALSENKMTDLEFSAVPAMRELLTNSALFAAIVSMLSPPSSTTTSGGGTNNPQQQQKIGRKRAPSEDLTHARKRQMLSPVPNRSNIHHVPNEQEKTSTSVLAATILYTVFQHVDHWPVQLIKAFAEDSFGPRIWVDDERCSAIVANFEQSIKTRQDDTDLSDATISAAEEAEKYFSSFITQNAIGSRSTAPSTSFQMKQPSAKEKRKLTAGSKMGTDTSSSSGEEEVLESEVLPCLSMASMPDQSHTTSADLSLRVIFSSSSPSDEKNVRSRYVSCNVELMNEAISDAFEERLNSKSKQNSRLLQILPLFLQIPRVRVLASRHLERWLQSPALAGLARTLFAEIVKHVEKVDPPLFDDIEVVDNILKLKLKANQLSIFVDHVAAIVKTLPSVSEQVFSHCIAQGDPHESTKDKLHILKAVYVTLDRKTAAATLASSIVTLESEAIDLGSKRDDIILLYKDLHAHLCKVVDILEHSFDGFHFVKSIIEAKSGTSSNITTAQHSSRLIMLCATLVTRRYGEDIIEDKELSQFRQNMLQLRKSIMKWCTNDLCTVYHNRVKQEEERKCSDSQFEHGAVVGGPGGADYSSGLDPHSKLYSSDQRSSFYDLMSIMRCLMFLRGPSSSDMNFLLGESSDLGYNNSVEFCCKYGVDIDDELVQLVLTSKNITPNFAVSLIENLVESCNVSSAARIINFSSETVLAMYSLAEYKPELRNKDYNDYDSTDESKYSSSDEDTGCVRGRPGNLDISSLPRLAVGSLWWRVSCIALVLCGLSPKNVGAALWNHSLTMRALIKMTTSEKFCFPTADCDEAERRHVKQMEKKTRDLESNIVEMLFMPPKKRNIKQKKEKSPTRAGSRFSARQREKADRLRVLEEERNAALLHAEELKLKKVLRSMQKNIMLFEEQHHPRKPPKGFDLLLSVNKHFGLAEKFRRVTDPDFLLQTVGEGRSAIERAYDWLIPIISSESEIIHRLQPNASSYLLLRAYGTEGEKNRELLDLTKPLLGHVKGCLTGEHGERHAMLAMELLMSDISSEMANRRVCSRRVLQEALGGENDTVWLSHVSHVKHAAVFIPLVVKSVSRACAYERGEVLSIYILGLSQYRDFMKDNDFNFVSTLCELISLRPHVFAEAFEKYELRSLCISEVKLAIDGAIAGKKGDTMSETDVTISVQSERIVLPQNVLGAFIVIMSNWQKGETTSQVEESNIMTLLKQLIVPIEESRADSVLSSAMRNGKRAVSVEEWVLLATSKADVIAKQSALSVPDIFLPRILLCSGMSRTIFVTMLERLTKLSDSVNDPAKLYNELISPSAVSEWGLQKGNRAVLKKRLHGRIASYLRIFSSTAKGNQQNELDAIAQCAFVTWLASEVSLSTAKKSESTTRAYDELIINWNASANDEESVVDLEDDSMDLSIDERVGSFDESTSLTEHSTGDLKSEKHINALVAIGKYDLIDGSLKQLISDAVFSKKDVDTSAPVKALMDAYVSSSCDSALGRLILKFAPQIQCIDSSLWRTLFVDLPEKSTDEQYLRSLVCECVANWSDEDVVGCQRWVLSQHGSKNALSMRLMLYFLVLSSEEKSVHYVCPDDDDKCGPKFICAKSKENVTSTMKMVLQYLEATTDTTSSLTPPCNEGRNGLPDWLILTLIMAKSHRQCIVSTIMEAIESKSVCSSAMYTLLLRLYLMFPTSLQLSDPKVRNGLIKSAKIHMKKSMQWRCSLDNQVTEILRNLGTSPKLIQTALDFTKTHPLIVIRHIRLLHERLLTDGTGGKDVTKVGRVGTRPPPITAQMGERSIKCTVVSWGFSFNESIWSSVLDLLVASPAELLFTCGIDTGVLLVLEDYLKLFYVHIMELGSDDSISQLRPKFVALIKSFMSCNSVAFQNWGQQTDIDGFGTVQTLLFSKVGGISNSQ